MPFPEQLWIRCLKAYRQIAVGVQLGGEPPERGRGEWDEVHYEQEVQLPFWNQRVLLPRMNRHDENAEKSGEEIGMRKVCSLVL